MSASDDQSEKECPLCMEAFDLDDFNFYPCKCEYQICRFCWHRLKTDENGLCPACRQPYPEDPVNFKPLTPEEFQRIKNEKKQREQLKKQKITDGRKHLSKVRVLQKNLVFVLGLPPRFCEPELLKRPEYFGKFGKVHKVVINGNTNYAGPSGPSAGIFITYYRQEDALRAIQNVNSVQIDGRSVKASLGTTKYCSNFLRNQPCHKQDCMYLHDIGDEAASFTKEDMQQHKHTDYERRLHEQILPQAHSNRRCRDSSAQRDVWPATVENENQPRPSDPIPIADGISNSASHNQGKHQHIGPRNRQGGARNRNRQQRGAANGAAIQKQRGDTKVRASPPASSTSPDRNGHSLPSSELFSSGSTQGLSMNNGNGGDSSQSTSSSPSPFSSSLPNGGGPSVEIPQFGSVTLLNGGSSSVMESVQLAEASVANNVGDSTTKSHAIGAGQVNVEKHLQQLVCNNGTLSNDVKSEEFVANSVDECLTNVDALFSKLNFFNNDSVADIGKFLANDLETKADEQVPSKQTSNVALDWQRVLGLEKNLQDDDLGFDPYMESSKALEEMVREEKEMNKQQQVFQQNGSLTSNSSLAASWDRFKSPPHQQHLQPHQRPVNIVRPSVAHWHPVNHTMANGPIRSTRPPPTGPFIPQSPPENHVSPPKLEFNSNYGTPPGFGADMSPHKINGMGGFSGSIPSFGQSRQHPQTNDAFLKEWQDGFRAILPNVNIKFAPNLSAPHSAPMGGQSPADQSYAPKAGWPGATAPSPRPSPDNNMFMFNRPPPPLVNNFPYPPPGMRRSPTADAASATIPPARINAPQPPMFARAVSPFRHDFMNWPLDDLSPTSHPPPGFMASPSQQNVA